MRAKSASDKLSKMLSYILERRPDEFGLTTDNDGFIKIKNLLKALNERDGWKFVRISHINQILMEPSAPAFEISDGLIRAKNREALPKHTIPTEHPGTLYTCVRRKAHGVVSEKGILAKDGMRVILSSCRDMAERVGRRIDAQPVLLTVHVQKALDEGVVFTQAGESMFVSRSIPANCFSAPALPKQKKAAPSSKKTDRREDEEKGPKHPGSFFVDPLKIDPIKNKKSKTTKKHENILWKKGIREIRRKKRSDFE